MSYILDALRKAEAERKLGSVPGLHSQATESAPDTEKYGAWKNPWLWTTVGMAVLLAAGGWYFLSARTVTPPAPPASPAIGQPMPPAPVVAPPAEAPAPLASAPAETAPEPPPVIEAKQKPETDAPPPKSKKKSAHSENERKAVEAAAPPKPSPNADYIAVSDLVPADAPPAVIGGYIYSPKPADRSVLINQKLMREGETISPELRIEQIAPQGVVFSYRGQRFRKNY